MKTTIIENELELLDIAASLIRKTITHPEFADFDLELIFEDVIATPEFKKVLDTNDQGVYFRVMKIWNLAIDRMINEGLLTIN